MIVLVNNKQYKVKVATTDKEKQEGLQNKKELPKDEGMLFVYGKPQTVGFWMKDTLIPLDIIFINEDQEVISVYKGKPNDTNIAEEDNVKYVLELNQNSGIKEGDDVDIDDEEDDKEDSPVMKVIGSDGTPQMELWGGERIFSRKNTKTLIRMSKKANLTKKDSDYKRLGKKMFEYIKQQDNREPEYVKLEESENK